MNDRSRKDDETRISTANRRGLVYQTPTICAFSIKRMILALLGTCLVLLLAGCTPLLISPPFAQSAPSAAAYTITGTVMDDEGPVAGALVKIQATEISATTDENGIFTLDGLTSAQPVTLVAWRKNYFFGFIEATPDGAAPTDTSPAIIQIRRHHRADNTDYVWEASANCGECHTAYAEWQADAHAQSAINQRFLTVFRGMDVDGNRSPNTDYDGGFPKAIESFDEYYGPGFKTDFPRRDGNCASCHAPMVSNAPTTYSCAWSGCHDLSTMQRSEELHDYSVTPVGISGVPAEGISCDFCHKIAKVKLDEETGLPPHDKPGLQALTIFRPPPDERFFMGSIDDVARDADSYNSLYKESAYCASCHYGVFSNTVVYNSYGEWVDSPYSAAETGQTCQDCHMPVAEHYETAQASVVNALVALEERMGVPLPAGLATVKAAVDKNYFVFPEQDGVFRPRNQVHNHDMPGAMDVAFLQSAVTMQVTAEITDDTVNVTVNVTNDGAGHHVPTGSPLRQMLLVVSAKDAAGTMLAQARGPVLPDWAGDVAGQPGKGFAKILEDALTGESPTIAHWRLVKIASDTRLPAQETDTTDYTFALSSAEQVTIEARLLYRRAFQQIAEWKGWDDPDIVMAENLLTLER